MALVELVVGGLLCAVGFALAGDHRGWTSRTTRFGQGLRPGRPVPDRMVRVLAFQTTRGRVVAGGLLLAGVAVLGGLAAWRPASPADVGSGAYDRHSSPVAGASGSFMPTWLAVKPSDS